MSATKATPAENPLQSPLRLLDAMFFVSEHERMGTPRPSKARFLFVNGMKSLGVGQLSKAAQQLAEALSEAERQAVPLKEEVAVCQIGLGFLHACYPPPQRDLSKSRELYEKALNSLAEFVGSPGSHWQLATLTADVAVICFSTGSRQEGESMLTRSRGQLQGATPPAAGTESSKHFEKQISQVFAQVAQVHAQFGDLRNAVSLMQSAVDCMTKYGDPSVKVATQVLSHLRSQLAKQQPPQP